jgi:hypothetical protein
MGQLAFLPYASVRTSLLMHALNRPLSGVLAAGVRTTPAAGEQGGLLFWCNSPSMAIFCMEAAVALSCRQAERSD